MSGGGNLAAPKAAFTLAEVLVTLGIIGLVSAMTVPTLMQNHQRKTYVTQLHKVYNELSQGLIRYQTDRNALNLTEAGLSVDTFSEFLKNYFKVVQDCENEQTPCFADSYKKIAGVDTLFRCDGACMVLANGAAIGVYKASAGYTNMIAEIVVDINGQQGPNIFGRDAFSLFLYKDGTIDDYSTSGVVPMTEELREQRYQTACIDSADSKWDGCFGKILNDNWEMTY